MREILTNVKTRRSLTGWFHTRDQLPPRMPLEAVEPKYVKKEFNVQQCTIFNEWINPLYLGLESMGRIQVNQIVKTPMLNTYPQLIFVFRLSLRKIQKSNCQIF